MGTGEGEKSVHEWASMAKWRARTKSVRIQAPQQHGGTSDYLRARRVSERPLCHGDAPDPSGGSTRLPQTSPERVHRTRTSLDAFSVHPAYTRHARRPHGDVYSNIRQVGPVKRSFLVIDQAAICFQAELRPTLAYIRKHASVLFITQAPVMRFETITELCQDLSNVI
jgi:hypothetical protein